MFEVKTRFRFSSEGGVGEKTRFGGGRFVIGTPSPTLHKHLLPPLPRYINIFYPLSPIAQTYFSFYHHHTRLSTQHKKNRIDRNQSYLKHDLINLLN